MELDELKQQWQALDRKLDRSVALNLRLLTETSTRRTKLRLLPLLLLQPIQLAIGFAVAISCARFWIRHVDSPALLISGLALHAFGIGLVVDALVRILIIARINFAAPVVTIQRYLAYLRHWEIRSFKWGWMIIWALLPAMLVAGVKAVSGVDLWASCPACVTWTAVASAVGMLASYLFDRWARTRDHACGIYVGYSVSAAQAALDEVDQFARN
jgi:hypothetical protein